MTRRVSDAKRDPRAVGDVGFELQQNFARRRHLLPPHLVVVAQHAAVLQAVRIARRARVDALGDAAVSEGTLSTHKHRMGMANGGPAVVMTMMNNVIAIGASARQIFMARLERDAGASHSLQATKPAPIIHSGGKPTMSTCLILILLQLSVAVFATTTNVESTTTTSVAQQAPRPATCNVTNWSAAGTECLKRYKAEHQCELCTLQQFPIWCAANVEKDTACTNKFESDCLAWMNGGSDLPAEATKSCACSRTAPTFPSFPRPNVTCVKSSDGCLLLLECQRADDNVTFSGAGCFSDRTWPHSRKRCSIATDTTAGGAQQQMSVVSAVVVVAIAVVTLIANI